MKNAGVPPQSVAAFSLLEGLDGSEKMSKSQDNYIGVNDDPEDMYGKVMSLPDELIGRWFELTTFSPEIEVNDIKKALTSENANPYDLKKRLAREIVVIYHGEDAADKAAQSFSNTFSKGEIPADIPEIKLNDSETLGEALVRQKIVPSKTQWRRLIDQNSVTELNSNKKVTDEKLVPQSGEVFRIGKKRFVRVTDN
jgi:tyrosyl-tRNA synthetase